ncbi:MAG: helix-turn-helix transcriptional regulator [Alphaproteobacteria bacterium]|nr:helix-turn-helix transcriptional regulator [Alphaproteobacteria bacterium]
MLSHAQIWSAIDRLADHNGMSVSGLARHAGLDPTSFNKSKRKSADGRLRWPSTESLSRILGAMDCSMERFMALVEPARTQSVEKPSERSASVPLLGFAQAGDGGYFDDGGYPAGHGWDLVDLPAASAGHTYALKVQGDSMLPLYRNGDTLIVEPEAQIRTGDRVVVKTKQGEVLAKKLRRQTVDVVELQSLNPDHPDRTFDAGEIEWIARIVWASQ